MNKQLPPNILVVDDTPENLTVLRNILTRGGYRVRPVLQGELALKVACADPPDLILLDIVMPGMDGYEVCIQLKATPITANCPVLFISALDSVDSKVRGFQVGGLDYITKPFHEEEVLARVRTHIALRAAQCQIQAQNTELLTAAALREDVDRILRHDVRGQLGNIIAYSELIADSVFTTPTLKDYANLMNAAAYSVLGMIHSSFDLIKMERGTYTTNPESFDLLLLLRQILHEMELSAKPKGIQLRILPDSLPYKTFSVLGERLLSRSMFYNLIKNAIEASPNNSIVEVWLQRSLEANSFAQIRVRNAGSVPESIRDRFFDKYVTCGKDGGTGLGTYSARLMAETQGGMLRLDVSEPGFTTLEVFLPQAPEFDNETGIETAVTTTEIPNTVWMLVADDDASNRAYLKHILSKNYVVELVENGEQALQLLQEQVINLALVDLEMPILNGLEVAKRYRTWLKTNDSGYSAKLIAFTGHHDVAILEQCLEAGFDQVVTKPVEKSVLLNLLQQMLSHSKIVIEMDGEIEALIPDFLVACQKSLIDLTMAIEQNDYTMTTSLAHRLRGSFAVYGFVQASRLTLELEHASKVENISKVQRLLVLLKWHLAKIEIRYR